MLLNISFAEGVHSQDYTCDITAHVVLIKLNKKFDFLSQLVVIIALILSNFK